MDIRETRRRAADELWKLIVSNPAPTEDDQTCEEYYTWLVGQLAEDPDFQALVHATAREMAKGEARQRELRSRSWDPQPERGNWHGTTWRSGL
jgi:hypothetical protein